MYPHQVVGSEKVKGTGHMTETKRGEVTEKGNVTETETATEIGETEIKTDTGIVIEEIAVSAAIVTCGGERLKFLGRPRRGGGAGDHWEPDGGRNGEVS